MRIGFYAPLKAPDHPVPSGDRQMSRMLIAALRYSGHEVEVYSRLRAFGDAADAPWAALQAAADAEVERVAAAWRDPALRPALLFTYHLYYKAPDLLGPQLAARFGLPYVTAEASLSARREDGPWAERQGLVAAAVRQAVVNICFTRRDRLGLTTTAAPESLADLQPFIDIGPYLLDETPAAAGRSLVTLAMMRPGDKLDSYRFLAAALGRLQDVDWHLRVVGDGPAAADVRTAFAQIPAARLHWVGAVPSEAVPDQLRRAAVFAWPGFNEAFGLCYLEAQAIGLPVVAVRNAGTPSVIRDAETGLLTEATPAAFAEALTTLLRDAPLRRRMGAAARAFVHGERSLPVAAERLDALLSRAVTSKEHAP